MCCGPAWASSGARAPRVAAWDRGGRPPSDRCRLWVPGKPACLVVSPAGVSRGSAAAPSKSGKSRAHPSQVSAPLEPFWQGVKETRGGRGAWGRALGPLTTWQEGWRAGEGEVVRGPAHLSSLGGVPSRLLLSSPPSLVASCLFPKSHTAPSGFAGFEIPQGSVTLLFPLSPRSLASDGSRSRPARPGRPLRRC